MKKIIRTAATYTAIGTLALLMGTAAIGCKETVREEAVQGPAGAPGATGAAGAQGEAAPANPSVSEKSDSSTTTTTKNGMPGTGSSTTTEKSSTQKSN
jgi:hypothetical protein